MENQKVPARAEARAMRLHARPRRVLDKEIVSIRIFPCRYTGSKFITREQLWSNGPTLRTIAENTRECNEPLFIPEPPVGPSVTCVEIKFPGKPVFSPARISMLTDPISGPGSLGCSKIRASECSPVKFFKSIEMIRM